MLSALWRNKNRLSDLLAHIICSGSGSDWGCLDQNYGCAGRDKIITQLSNTIQHHLILSDSPFLFNFPVTEKCCITDVNLQRTVCVDIDKICTDRRKGKDCKFSNIYTKHYFPWYLKMLEGSE